MRFSTIISILILAAGVLAGPAITAKTKRDDGAPPPPPPAPETVNGSRCKPCNDRMDQCMGKWGCWFYDCHQQCTQEVCESSPDCRQGCGFHC
ncbi:hypothetical protein PMIN06_005713 [Paraphaeosphaeria minitans]